MAVIRLQFAKGDIAIASPQRADDLKRLIVGYSQSEVKLITRKRDCVRSKAAGSEPWPFVTSNRSIALVM